MRTLKPLVPICFLLSTLQIFSSTSFACSGGPVCYAVGQKATIYGLSFPVEGKGGQTLIKEGTIVGIYDFDHDPDSFAYDPEDYHLSNLKPDPDNKPPFNAALPSSLKEWANEGYAFVPVSAQGTNCIYNNAYVIKCSKEEAKRVLELVFRFGPDYARNKLHCVSEK